MRYDSEIAEYPDGIPIRASLTIDPQAGKITIDLTRFEGVDDDEARVLHRYVNTIQVQRQDFNGRMLTIRRDDLRAIAAAAGIEVDALVRRLDLDGLAHSPRIYTLTAVINS